MKKIFFKRAILLLVLSLISFSCAVDINNKMTGTIQLELCGNNISRNADAASMENNLVYPGEYFITVYSVESKKNVIEQTFSAGDIVISNLPLGLLEITVEGKSAGYLFTGTAKYDLQEESVKLNIEMESVRLSGNINITINSENGKFLDKYYYSILNDKDEYLEKNKIVPIKNGVPESILINDLYTGSKYKVVMLGEDSNYLYKGVGKADSEVLKSDTVTNVVFNNFQPVTGSLRLSYKAPLTEELSVSLIKKDTGAIIRTEKIKSLPYVFNKLVPDTYTVSIESSREDINYMCSDILTVTSGGTVEGSVIAGTKTVYYVSETGNDNDFGVKDLPFRTISKVLETAKTETNISICVSGNVSDSINITSDKEIEIFGNSSSANKITGGIIINSPGAKVTLKNIEADNITVTDGKFILADGVKLATVSLAPEKIISIIGNLINTKTAPITVTLENYVKGQKVLNTFLNSEIEKLKLANENYKFDVYGNCDIKTGAVTVNIPDFGTYTPSSFRYELYDKTGAKIEEKSFSQNNFTPSTLLDFNENYKIIVFCEKSGYSYKGTVDVMGGTPDVNLTTFDSYTGSLKITAGTATIGNRYTLKLINGAVTKEYNITSLPHTIDNLEAGIYSVEITGDNPEENLENIYGKVVAGTSSEISLKAVPNNVFYVNEIGGNDYNNGVNGSPLATVSHAAEKILAMSNGEVSTQYVIKVKGNIEETKSVLINKDCNIKIEGVGSGATITSVETSENRNSSRRVIVIGKENDSAPATNPTVTLKNIKITGGLTKYDNWDGKGSGIYVATGNLNLEDGTVVQGNTYLNPQPPKKNSSVYIDYDAGDFCVSGNVQIGAADSVGLCRLRFVKTKGLFTGAININEYEDITKIVEAEPGSEENYKKFTVTAHGNEEYDNTSGSMVLKTLTLAQLKDYVKNENTYDWVYVKVNVSSSELAELETAIANRGLFMLDLTPSNLTEIPAEAFNYTDKYTSNYRIKNLKLPSTLTKIGDNAFANIGMKYAEEPLVIPTSVTSFGANAFAGTAAVEFEDKTSTWSGNSQTFTPTENGTTNAGTFINQKFVWTKNKG